jgi:hypothetical protein
MRVKPAKELPVRKSINRILTNQFRKLFISYAKMMNDHRDDHGQIFCTPFKRIEITDDSYFTQIVYYIHCNPVHHKITKEPGEYKYSSYHCYTSSRPSGIKSEEVLNWFGGKDPFVKYHQLQSDALKKLPFNLEY